jgi:hypothetical protein
MWRMNSGDRVLTKAEWDVFVTGLDLLRDFIESDISAKEDTIDTGVPAFNRLTAEQKLALLAEVSLALRDPTVPTPRHTAANEGAIIAVLDTFRDMLRSEIEANEAGGIHFREKLLAAVRGSEEAERLPKPTSKRWEIWDDLHQCIVERVLWDYDFNLGDEFLDLPPDVARERLELAGIDPDYFLSIPPEPGQKGLTDARRTLANLIVLGFFDESGH